MGPGSAAHRFALRSIRGTQASERPGAIPAFLFSAALTQFTDVIIRQRVARMRPMTGSSGSSSIPHVLDSISGGGDYWMPAFAGMTGRAASGPGLFWFALRNPVYRRHHPRKRMIQYSARSRFHLWRRRLQDARLRGHDRRRAGSNPGLFLFHLSPRAAGLSRERFTMPQRMPGKSSVNRILSGCRDSERGRACNT
jgi:hypothetical protein